ncbi:MAG: hypothetical protein V4487_07600 [Chlamydiota bacterium]
MFRIPPIDNNSPPADLPESLPGESDLNRNLQIIKKVTIEVFPKLLATLGAVQLKAMSSDRSYEEIQLLMNMETAPMKFDEHIRNFIKKQFEKPTS